jgi:DNA repair protein RadD
MGFVSAQERCGYRWTFKECAQCLAPNDIAARVCASCGAEIVDPNERLAAEFRAIRRDPTRRQTDAVVAMRVTPGVSRRGNSTIRVDYVTPYRSFSIWYLPESGLLRARDAHAKWAKATDNGKNAPKTITYRKDETSGFFVAYNYDQPLLEDEVLCS